MSQPPPVMAARWPRVGAKYLAPELPAHHVSRPRLGALVAPPGARVTVVAAPAGAGKSVLVREWAHAHPEVRIAWLSLEESDSAPMRFWTEVLHALQSIDERIGVEAMGRLLEGEEATDEVLTGLVADVEQWADRPIALVLDDYHVLNDPRVHAQLTWLLEHRATRLWVVITSRADPSLPVGRWRVRGELAEIRAADLRFDEAEAEDLLAGFAGVVLQRPDLQALEERTEGWAAGLQLAALALQRTEDQHGFVAQFGGTERTVSEFLFQEVLERQPEDVRHFLLHTSVLDSLTASLCDAVTGGSDGAAMLQRLEGAQLFVIGLDRAGGWFRYHRLFADLLRSELRLLDAPAVRAAHERAAAWYEANDLPGAAVQHARATGDVELVLAIIARNAGALWARGFTELIRESLASLPASVIEADAARAVDYAYALGVSGWVGEAFTWVDRVEPRLAADDPLRTFISAARAIAAGDRGAAGQFFEAYEPISRAMGETVPYPDAIGFARVFCQRMLTLTEDPDVGRAAYLETAAVASSAAVIRNGAPEGALAEGLAIEGRLREAASEAERSLAVWNDDSVTLRPAVCDALRASARVHLEAGGLEEAEGLLEAGLPVAEAIGSVYQVGMCAGVLAELARARGDAQAAIDRLAGSNRRLRGVEPGPELRAWLSEIAVRAALDLGDADAANRLAVDVAHPTPSSDAVAIRLALAAKDWDRARKLLDEHRPRTLRRQVEGALLHARLAAAQIDQDASARYVARALDLSDGEPLGWTFAQECDLHAVYAGAALADRVPRFEVTSPVPVPQPAAAPKRVAALVEQLSDRELRVLELLPTHLSNQEIAGELYVSLNTVKTHLKSIYRKLAASSRSEAVRAARALGLLP